jgi:hypothetical protein
MKRSQPMIYVLTVHWRFDFWVDVQIRHLRRYLRDPFRIYAFCDRTKSDHSAKFDYCAPEKGIVDHASKLNALAAVVCETAEPDDVLVFCDSDAFPMRDITDYLRAGLQRWPLVAVQRLENAGDVQPHPCFALTTAGFWRRIRGDWRAGPTWTNADGQAVTDVGANLLRALTLQHVEWGKMLRSHRIGLHPLLFSLYDGVVYHHGAGSRPTVGGRGVRRRELAALDSDEATRRSRELQQQIAASSRRVLDILWRDRDDELLALLG